MSMFRRSARSRIPYIIVALCLSSAPIAGFAQAAGVMPRDSITERMMMRIAALSADSMEGRRAGSVGAVRARRWIVGQLTAMGARPAFATFEQAVKLPARGGTDTVGANIVARIPGRRVGGPVTVASAHYDHLGTRNGVVYNGADDDASGCVALLTLAERLLREPPQHDVILAFFDAEELGGFGARTFVAAPAVPLPQIAFDLSLDMVSRQDGKALWVAGTSHYPFLKPWALSAAQRSVIPVRFGHDTKSLKPGDDWTGSSDHKAFHDKGIPFLYLGVEDHADYHQPGDDADKIDPLFFRGAVEFAIALLRTVDSNIGKFPAR